MHRGELAENADYWEANMSPHNDSTLRRLDDDSVRVTGERGVATVYWSRGVYVIRNREIEPGVAFLKHEQFDSEEGSTVLSITSGDEKPRETEIEIDDIQSVSLEPSKLDTKGIILKGNLGKILGLSSRSSDELHGLYRNDVVINAPYGKQYRLKGWHVDNDVLLEELQDNLLELSRSPSETE